MVLIGNDLSFSFFFSLLLSYIIPYVESLFSVSFFIVLSQRLLFENILRRANLCTKHFILKTCTYWFYHPNVWMQFRKIFYLPNVQCTYAGTWICPFQEFIRFLLLIDVHVMYKVIFVFYHAVIVPWKFGVCYPALFLSWETFWK